MKRQKLTLLVFVLTGLFVLTGCYTQLQTTRYEQSDQALSYYSEERKQARYQKNYGNYYGDVRIQYRNYEVADWYRDHYISPGILNAGYNYHPYNSYFGSYSSPFFHSWWQNPYFAGFYHPPFYRSFYSPWHRGFNTYFSFSIGFGFDYFSPYRWTHYGVLSPYGFNGSLYYPGSYYFSDSQTSDRDHRVGPRGSGIQRSSSRGVIHTKVRSRGDRSHGTVRGSGLSSTRQQGTVDRTRSADRDRRDRSRDSRAINRDSDSRTRDSGRNTRESGRSERRSLYHTTFDHYKPSPQNSGHAERSRSSSERNRSGDVQNQTDYNRSDQRSRDSNDRNVWYNPTYRRSSSEVQQQPSSQVDRQHRRDSSTRTFSTPIDRRRSTFHTMPGMERQNAASSIHQRNRTNPGQHFQRSSPDRSRSSSTRRTRSSGRDRR